MVRETEKKKKIGQRINRPQRRGNGGRHRKDVAATGASAPCNHTLGPPSNQPFLSHSPFTRAHHVLSNIQTWTRFLC